MTQTEAITAACEVLHVEANELASFLDSTDCVPLPPNQLQLPRRVCSAVSMEIKRLRAIKDALATIKTNTVHSVPP